MEGALARAVNFGAATLNQEIRAVMPDMLVLAGESTARGFHLDGYGVFFDVEVPVLRQSMMWSLRTMLDQDQQGATEALTALRRFVASTSKARSGRRRKRRCAGSKPRSARSATATRTGRRRGRRGQRRRRPAGRRARPRPAAAGQPAAAQRPQQGLHRGGVKALIDAMVDYSLPMVSSMQAGEVLTVAARDNERRDLLAPPNPYEEVSTVMLRIKGSDLAEYRAGKIDRDEARKRVQVQEF